MTHPGFFLRRPGNSCSGHDTVDASRMPRKAETHWERTQTDTFRGSGQGHFVSGHGAVRTGGGTLGKRLCLTGRAVQEVWADLRIVCYTVVTD